MLQLFNESNLQSYFLIVSLQLLTPSVLINRLINAHKYLLALRISEYLGMSQVSSQNFISHSNCIIHFWSFSFPSFSFSSLWLPNNGSPGVLFIPFCVVTHCYLNFQVPLYHFCYLWWMLIFASVSRDEQLSSTAILTIYVTFEIRTHDFWNLS